MSTFKVQRIRSCVQCGEMLSLKCKACVKHPERKARVLEFYDWPGILKTAECGCCIKIACQGAGCVQTVWRNSKHNRGGKSISKAFYCSVTCSARSMAAARCTRQTVPCAYCTKPVVKKSYALKTWTQSFCNNSCYFLFRAKAKHDAAEVKKVEPVDVGMLQCQGPCKDITEHDTPSEKRPAKCRACGTERRHDTGAIGREETFALLYATRNGIRR